MARLLYPGRIATFREQGAKDKAPRKKKTLLGAIGKGAAIGLGTGVAGGALLAGGLATAGALSLKKGIRKSLIRGSEAAVLGGAAGVGAGIPLAAIGGGIGAGAYSIGRAKQKRAEGEAQLKQAMPKFRQKYGI